MNKLQEKNVKSKQNYLKSNNYTVMYVFESFRQKFFDLKDFYCSFKGICQNLNNVWLPRGPLSR